VVSTLNFCVRDYPDCKPALKSCTKLKMVGGGCSYREW
jgi:hypothetical protein